MPKLFSLTTPYILASHPVDPAFPEYQLTKLSKISHNLIPALLEACVNLTTLHLELFLNRRFLDDSPALYVARRGVQTLTIKFDGAYILDPGEDLVDYEFDGAVFVDTIKSRWINPKVRAGEINVKSLQKVQLILDTKKKPLASTAAEIRDKLRASKDLRKQGLVVDVVCAVEYVDP
ncbi:hypothetical protein J3R30DRAFT_3725287 [Lentinula aciculospora]|uniref:Uncharacterized protein n=1 Tax=Lentinula aciculospora TaxID=153920 RepID=A0A9W8ZRW2_9AGAR|nr:hypothetical protein J3R30DRAFT_3725287 [Lentinula aciculospora]